MSYLESPPGFRNIQGTDYLNTIPGMDLPDQRVNLDIETFIRCVPLGFFSPNFGSSGGCVSFGTGPPGRIISPAALPSGRVIGWRGQKPTEHCRAHTHTHIPGVRLCSRRSCDFGSTAKVCVEFVRGINQLQAMEEVSRLKLARFRPPGRALSATDHPFRICEDGEVGKCSFQGEILDVVHEGDR